MATVEDLVIQALARAMEFGDTFPTTRSVMYRRLGVRQQQLFAAVARENPEYFGDSAIGTLDANGAIDIGLTGNPDAPDPVEAMEVISRIEVENKGTSALTNGQEINTVPLTDPDAAFAPRVTIRGNIIRQVATDLAGVTSIRVYYSKRPFRLDPDDKNTLIVLPEPFHDLLVVDLTRWLLRKAATVPEQVRTVALGALDAEETEGIGNFLAQAREYTSAVERGRFGRTAGATKQ